MFSMRNVNAGLVRGRDTFLSFAPGPAALFRSKFAVYAARCVAASKIGWKLKKGMEIEDVIGKSLGRYILANSGKARATKLFSRTLRSVGTSHVPLVRGLNATTRTWYSESDRSVLDDRIVRKLTIMYHDANKAGKHLDVHLGHLSLVYRVSGKPVESKIKFNHKGELTQGAKDELVQHIRSELSNNSRVPWNHDHTVSNAGAKWLPGTPTRGYGSGLTRQCVLRDKVEFFHPRVGTSLHFYAPKLNPHQGLYIHELYPGDSKKAPILVCGNLIPRDGKFEDRLHLKMIQDEEFKSKFLPKVDPTSITRKYDGASTYFSSNGQGFKFFSPRYSKTTGHRLEYTYKLPEMADKGSTHNPTGMGELLFWKRTPLGWAFWNLTSMRGPEYLMWNYLSAAEIGGILNSDKVRSRWVLPEVRVYRMDRWNGSQIHPLSFHLNRSVQLKMVRELDLPFWKVVSKALPLRRKDWEGLVAVPKGLSINDGYKIKWWQDANDWEVTDVKFGISPKGAINGVVCFRSTTSGRDFNLGPGQMGDAEQCLAILQAPSDYVGQVAKVVSRNGHEGRAAKFAAWHTDKGKGG